MENHQPEYTITAPQLANLIGQLINHPDQLGQFDEELTHIHFLHDLARVVADHCGGDVHCIQLGEAGTEVVVKANDCLPDLEHNVWTQAATETIQE